MLEFWSTCPLEVLIDSIALLYFEGCFVETPSILYGDTLCWNFGALDPWKCIDSIALLYFEGCICRESINSIWRDLMLESWSTGPLEVYQS